MATALSPSQTGSMKVGQVLTCVFYKGQNSSGLMCQLPCFHVCHRNCMKGELRNARPGSEFKCTECNKTCLVPGDGLVGFPDELLQYKMKEIADLFSNTPLPCEMCKAVGSENESSHFCITCKKPMCSEDTKRHKIQDYHDIVPYSDIQKEEHLPHILTSQKPVCPIHKTKSLEFYCQKCKDPLCHICSNTDHKSHETISTQAARDVLKKEIKDKMIDISYKKMLCQTAEAKIKTLLNEVEKKSQQQVQECREWADDFKKTLDKVVNNNVIAIEKVAQNQRDRIIEIQKEIINLKRQFQSSEEYMDVFMQHGSGSDFLQNYKRFMENLGKCSQLKVRVEMYTKTFEIHSENMEAIEKNLINMLRAETVNESHGFGELELIGCELETKWETDSSCIGVAVDGDDTIAVTEQGIQIFGMNGETKEQIKCQGLGDKEDVEIVKKKIYISDKHKREILVIDRKGKLERKISLPTQEHGLKGRLCLAADHSNEDLFIGSELTQTVYKCSTGQTQADPFITTRVYEPMFLCVTPTHELVVSQWRYLTKYGRKGTLLWEKRKEERRDLNSARGFTRLISGHYGFPDLTRICVDTWGQIYVCDLGNDCIHRVSKDGNFLSFIDIDEHIPRPRAITFNNNKIIVSSYYYNSIYVIKCKYN